MILMKKKVLFTFFLPLLLLSTACGTQQRSLQQETIAAMDTLFSLTVATDDTGVMENAIATLTELSALLDCHSNESAVSLLNEAHTLECSDDTLPRLLTETAVLQAKFGNEVQLTCRPLTALWGIATDHPYIPTQEEILAAQQTIDDSGISVHQNTITLPDDASLDLGAVAKGYALDRVAAQLVQTDTEYAVISAASAVLLYGQKPDDKAFTLQITDPQSGSALGTVTISHTEPQQITMVGTSGGYARYSEIDGTRYCHILDLQTGAPAISDLTCVTVFCENGLMADFLSTTIFLGGTAQLGKHLSADDYLVLAVDTNGDIFSSEPLQFSKAEVMA